MGLYYENKQTHKQITGHYQWIWTHNCTLSMWNINPVFTFPKALPYLHITHSEDSSKQDLKQGLGMWKTLKTQIWWEKISAYTCFDWTTET